MRVRIAWTAKRSSTRYRTRRRAMGDARAHRVDGKTVIYEIPDEA